MSFRKIKILNILILFFSVALAASLITLATRIILDKSVPADTAEPYPDLYVSTDRHFVMPEEPTIYLTFDDGPSKNTEKILDILKKEGVKATFFVSCQYRDKEYSASLLRRMVDEGHTIGLHTSCHQYEKIYKSVEGYLSDLNEVNEFVVVATGIHPALIRFPGGSGGSRGNPALMRKIVKEINRRGYIYHDWTIVSGDDGHVAAPVDKITRRILNGTGSRHMEVVLCHDHSTPTTTPEAIAKAISVFREEGYLFDCLNESTPPVQFLKLD